MTPNEGDRKLTADEEQIIRLIEVARRGNDEIQQLKEDARRATQQQGREIKGLQQRLEQIDKESVAKIDALTKKAESAGARLNLLVTAATGKAAGDAYGPKAQEEKEIVTACETCFLGSIIALAVLAASAVIVNVAASWGKENPFLAFLANVPYMTLCLLPIYVPIVWYACHKNHQATVARRLEEAYEHKSRVGKAFIGLTSEIKEIEKADSKTANMLLSRLVETIVDIYGRDPAQLIMCCKDSTPLSEIAEGGSKVIDSTANLVKAIKIEPK